MNVSPLERYIHERLVLCETQGAAWPPRVARSAGPAGGLGGHTGQGFPDSPWVGDQGGCAEGGDRKGGTGFWPKAAPAAVPVTEAAATAAEPGGASAHRAGQPQPALPGDLGCP